LVVRIRAFWLIARILITTSPPAARDYVRRRRVRSAQPSSTTSTQPIRPTITSQTSQHYAEALSLRQDAPSGTDAAVGQGIFAVYEWTFRIGPGVFAGIGNGLILGWLMYRSGLVPPRFALFGLVGGPLVSIVGFLVILDVLPADGPFQVLVAPEFIWELGIGIYLIVKGYRTSSPALAGTQEAPLA
jgi:hypothetical protein